MKEKIKSWTRPTGKWTDILLIASVLMVALIIAGDLLAELIYLFFPYEKLFG